jgi:hypothetical protein
VAARRRLGWDWDGTWPPAGSSLEHNRTRELIEFASDIALRICGPSLGSVAEDVASEAVWRVVSRLRMNAQTVENLEAYVVRSIYNGVKGEARTHARREALAERLQVQQRSDVQSPEAKLVAREDVVTLFDRVWRRRPRMKDGDLVLRALELIDAGYNQQEAADRLGITRNNLAKKLADYTRAARELRREEADD